MAEDNTSDKHIKADKPWLWKEGQSGNPLGRPKRKTLTELIHKKLDETPDGWNKLVALVLTEIFTNKNKDVMKELWHYTDGMPKEKHEHSGQIAIPILNGVTQQNDLPTNNSDTKALEAPEEN